MKKIKRRILSIACLKRTANNVFPFENISDKLDAPLTPPGKCSRSWSQLSNFPNETIKLPFLIQSEHIWVCRIEWTSSSDRFDLNLIFTHNTKYDSLHSICCWHGIREYLWIRQWPSILWHSRIYFHWRVLMLNPVNYSARLWRRHGNIRVQKHHRRVFRHGFVENNCLILIYIVHEEAVVWNFLISLNWLR